MVLYALGGLGETYESFVTFIYTRPTRPTFDEIHALLLSQEARLLLTLSRLLTPPLHLLLSPPKLFTRPKPQHPMDEAMDSVPKPPLVVMVVDVVAGAIIEVEAVGVPSTTF